MFSSIAALLAMIAMAVVAGCGGNGSNPTPHTVPAEEIVAKYSSPTATIGALANAATDSFATIGTSTPSSPLYNFPADPMLATLIANQQKATNGGDTTLIATLSQIHGALDTDTESGFIANLNAFLAANYNGSNSYLRSLARLISGAPGTAPVYSASSTFQPYQTYYIVIWSMIQYAPLTRDDAACAEAARHRRIKDFYNTWPFSWFKPDGFDESIDSKIAIADGLCHEQ